jgi:capsular polysaccharide biosynthesis protein
MANSNRRGRWGSLLIAAGVIILLAAGAAWYLVPVRYEAFALLKVASTPPTVLTKGEVAPDDFDIFRRTQAQLVKSHVVLNGTLREPSINALSIVQPHQDDTVGWLSSRLIIDYPNDAEIMRIAMKGEKPDEVKKIVDKVAEVYLREIVYRDKQLRLENEEKLKKAYEKQKADYEMQLAALAKLREIHHTRGSETAELKKSLAMDELNMWLAQRAQITDEIRQTDLEIELAKIRGETTKEVRTGDSVVARGVAAGEPLPLAMLMRKREILQAQLKKAEDRIKGQVQVVASLENFSEKVAAKQEEVEALGSIKNKLGAKLDQSDVERLAPDRISLVDKAVLVDNEGDAVRRYAGLSAAGILGLALIVLGVVLRLPRRRES